MIPVPPATQQPSEAALAACVGYIVSGAGSAGVNGCYTRDTTAEHYVLGKTGHSLYRQEGVWHIGQSGKSVSYGSAHNASAPPGGPASRTVPTTRTRLSEADGLLCAMLLCAMLLCAMLLCVMLLCVMLLCVMLTATADSN